MGKCTIKFDRQREIKTGRTKKQLKRESLIDRTRVYAVTNTQTEKQSICSNKHKNRKRKQAQLRINMWQKNWQ